MAKKKTITFCATGKTGLGHLRRVTNIAQALCERRPTVSLELLTNGSGEGLTGEELTLYRHIKTVPRADMAGHLTTLSRGPVVVDTAVLPGLSRLDAPLCLILREAMPDKLEQFRLEGRRPWDLIILPNPAHEWRLDPASVPARRVEAVGWIYRRPWPPEVAPEETGFSKPTLAHRQVLITTGAGGIGDTWACFRADVARLIADLRNTLRTPVEIAQALGPCASAHARIDGVDRTLHPGPKLHEIFPQADLVISTVGYNSVLELACTDVPVLFIPIPKTFDDQERRSRRWGSHLGMYYDTNNPGAAVGWMVDMLDRRLRRPVVELGESGALKAAALLEELLA